MGQIDQLERRIEELQNNLKQIKEEKIYHKNELVQKLIDYSERLEEEDCSTNKNGQPNQIKSIGMLKLCKEAGIVDEDAKVRVGGGVRE